jgi:hypothetical protein
MNATRAQAYGRVTRAVELAYPDLLTVSQVATIRESADVLVFAWDARTPETDEARDRARTVLEEVLASHGVEWWVDEMAEALRLVAPREPAERVGPSWRRRLSASHLR